MADTADVGASGGRLTFPELPASALRRLEGQCWEFEARWQKNQPPPLESFLAAAATEPERAFLLRELLFLEREYRQRRGETPTLAEYQMRFPEHAELIAEVFASAAPPPAAPADPNITRRAVRGDSIFTFGADAGVPREPYPGVPEFEILGILGHGGMGVVYRAREVRLNRIVALKMIRAGAQARLEDLVRFRIEGETVARLQHPHIVQIFKVGEHDAQPFLALEYVEGGSLKQRLQRGALALEEAAALIEVLARAVHYAHQQGVVHRDLKPANILLAPEGQPKITDFGLAKFLGEDMELTQSGAILGTPSYMAPEQAAGNANRVGPASDIYALGAVLYELLGGQPPFAGSHTAEAMVRLVTEDAPSLVKVRPNLPRDLITICDRCMEREPARRYATAEALADDLKRYQAGEPIQARPVGSVERLWKWARRRPAVAALWAGVIGVALIGAAGILWQWSQALEARDQAARREVDAIEARNDAQEHAELAWKAQRETQQALQQAESQLYFSHIAQARLQVSNGNTAAADLLLDQCPPKRRGWEWRYLRGQLHGDLLTIAAHPNGMVALQCSPDGRWLVSAGEDVKIWDADTGALVRTLPRFDAAVHSLAFQTPEGKYLAVGYRDGVARVFEPGTGTLVQTIRTSNAPFAAAALAFQPGTSVLVIAGDDGAVRVWDAVTGKENPLGMRHTGPVNGLAVSPDGRRLASCGVDGTRIWDSATGKQVGRIPYRAYSVRFSPDGGTLGIVHGQVAKLWSLASLQELQTLGGHTGGINGGAYSHDGLTFATAGVDGLVVLWNSRTGEVQSTRVGHRGSVAHCAFHPNGRVLITGDPNYGEIKLWDLTRRLDLTKPHRFEPRFDIPPHDVMAVGFQANHRDVVMLRSGGQLQVRDAMTAALRTEHVLPINRHWPFAAGNGAVSADGAWVAAVSPRLRIWEVTSGKEVFAAPAPTTFAPKQASLSRDGRRVALAEESDDGQRQVRVLDVPSGAVVFTVAVKPRGPATHEPAAPVLSPDGLWLAAEVFSEVGPTSLKLRELDTGRELWSAGLEATLVSATFSADGRYLASAGQDGRIQIWEANRGAALHPQALPGLPGLRALAISPDGRLLAAHGGSRLRLLDIQSGQEILNFDTIFRHYSIENAYLPVLAWSADGERLAASDYFRNVLVFDASQHETASAKKRWQQDAEARAFAWHLARAEACLDWSMGQPALERHMKRVEAGPAPDRPLRWERAFLQARRSRWKTVAADCADLSLAEEKDRPQLLMLQACACLQTGDVAGYRERCGRLRDAMGPKSDRSTRAEALQTCLLFPSVTEARSLLERARELRSVQPAEDAVTEHNIAWASFRTGNLDETVRLVESIQRVHPDWNRRALNALLLAAVYQRQGKTRLAAEHRTQAEAWLGVPPGKLPPEALPRWHWLEWLEAHILHAEAIAPRPASE